MTRYGVRIPLVVFAGFAVATSFLGCGRPIAEQTGATPAAGRRHVTAEELRRLLDGKYEDKPGPASSLSVSFRYPRFMRHTYDKQVQVGGTFEILDDHLALRNSGLYGTGTLVLLTQSAFSSEPSVLLIRPAVNEQGDLDGLYVVGLFAQKLKPQQQFLIRYVGPPEIPEGEKIQYREIKPLPDFMPRVNSNF